jgi:hypothetical protein
MINSKIAWLTYKRSRMPIAEFEIWRVKSENANAIIESAIRKYPKDWLKRFPKEALIVQNEIRDWTESTWLECFEKAKQEIANLEIEFGRTFPSPEAKENQTYALADKLCVQQVCPPPHWKHIHFCETCGPVLALNENDLCAWCEVLTTARLEQKRKLKRAEADFYENVFKPIEKWEREWDEKNQHLFDDPRALEEALDKSLDEIWPSAPVAPEERLAKKQREQELMDEYTRIYGHPLDDIKRMAANRSRSNER